MQYRFEDFIAGVAPAYRKFVVNIHESLLRDSYNIKIESKISGMTASYAHPKTRRNVLSFFFRKANLLTRVYADNLAQYTGFLNRLPEKMEKEIAKASLCKRLVNPDECNPKCIKGYDFFVRKNHYQKCRYNCFQFEVNAESIPVLADFIENERKER